MQGEEVGEEGDGSWYWVMGLVWGGWHEEGWYVVAMGAGMIGEMRGDMGGGMARAVVGMEMQSAD